MSIRCCGGSLLPKLGPIEQSRAVIVSQIITEVALGAMRAFLEKQLALFDAAVGDNSCKVRAFVVTLLASQPAVCQEASQLFDALQFVVKKIEAIIPNKGKVNVGEFRQEKGLEFSLSPHLSFLIQAHFLTGKKALSGIGTTIPKDWVHQMKQRLASASVNFLRLEAALLESSRKDLLQKMVADPFLKHYSDRPVAPNFYSMEILFRRALQEKLLVIFKSRVETSLFEPNQTGTTLVPKLVEWEDLGRPAILIQGSVNAVFDKKDFFSLLLARAAQDPQYLEEPKSEPIAFTGREEEEDFQKPQLVKVPFTISHILPGTVSMQPYHSCNWMGDDLNVPSGFLSMHPSP